MAWRLDENVEHGEIDNRTRGRVTGRIWFAGCDEPMILELAGNAWRDLAGRRLEFVNPDPKPGPAGQLTTVQRGTTGDITASRKVRVPDIPLEEIGEYYAARKPFPWHWGNSLYLEWFSAANGRVVIESASYQLTVAPDSTWEMTPEEEEVQRRENTAGMTAFMTSASEALQVESDDDPVRPQTEAEAEKASAESEQLIDRVMARLEREGESASYERILSEEIERARRERGEPDLTPDEEAERGKWIEEVNAAATEALEEDNADAWKRDEANTERDTDNPLAAKHPLVAQAFKLSIRVRRETHEHGWQEEDAGREHPVTALIDGITNASAKLAGSLGGDDWPPPLDFCAGRIVRLKKAAKYLDDANLAAESCGEEELVDAAWLAEVNREIGELVTGTDALIAELRARLEGGT